ncbi:oxidoreductase [Planctomycetota bacterium]|nr:oxidoreductase [Planctomycetota bacterium]
MNRIALITGASSGIGAAVARALAGRWRLVLVARRKDRLDALVDEIHRDGGDAVALPADLATDPQGIAERAAAIWQGLDAIVNNAGLFATSGSDALTAEHLDQLWRINLRAPMLLTAAAIPYMRARHGGSIVNVSSVAADTAFSGCGAYAATKAALEAWSRVLREELRRDRIRVSVVAPGATDTGIWPAGFNPPIDRMCRAADIAAAIRFILEQPASASIDRMVITPPGGAL